MLAFAPLLIPFLIFGAGACALTAAAVKGGDDKKHKIKALKDRIERLEKGGSK
jgi:hypothetical protein